MGMVALFSVSWFGLCEMFIMIRFGCRGGLSKREPYELTPICDRSLLRAYVKRTSLATSLRVRPRATRRGDHELSDHMYFYLKKVAGSWRRTIDNSGLYLENQSSDRLTRQRRVDDRGRGVV